MKSLEELIDDLFDDKLEDLDEYSDTDVMPSNYKDDKYLKELGILIEEYEE